MNTQPHCLKTIALATALALGSAAAFAQAPGPEQLFPNAKPGECYARVFLPPTVATESQQIVKQEASQRVQLVPARYETGSETVVLKEASKRLEVVPATYEWVTEQVVVRPAAKRLQTVPATYETVTEKVLVKAGYSTWKKGVSPSVLAAAGPNGTRTDAAGDVLCLVEVPPVYGTVAKRVEKSPATTTEIDIPEVTKTVRRQVQKTPPSTREVEIPAVTQQVPVTKMVEPPKENRIDIPAQYQTVTSTKQVTAGRYEWRSILCQTNATPDKIQQIQTALKGAGFDPGPIDGILKQQTMRAVNAYQSSKSLPVDPYLNMETVKSLGVSL